MSVIWSGVTAEGAVVPVQVTAEGKVIAVGDANFQVNGIQKVAYLKDEKPSGTNGGASVVGWQDRTLNTKEDANNLVVLGNDKEFTLSAGEYQIEWSAPGYRVERSQTKLTNVTDGTTQETGSSEYSSTSSAAQTRSFGSTRVKITTDTTYKIEHFCAAAQATNGLGDRSVSGEPEVYTQVTITDLAIVSGGALFGDVVIGSGGKQWLIRESNGVAMLIEQSFPQLKEEKLRDLPNELDLIEAALNEVMEKLRMTPPAGWPVWDGSDNA